MGIQHLEAISGIVCPFISGEVSVALSLVSYHVCNVILKLIPVKL